MEHFVAQNLFEDRARGRIVVDEASIDFEPAGGGFFSDVKKREQPMVGFPFDAQVVEAVAAGKRIAVEERRSRGAHAQQRCAALAKQDSVMKLVNGVFEVQTPKQGVTCQLGRAENVATSVGLDVCESQKLPDPPIEISPHPLVNWSKQRVERRRHRWPVLCLSKW